MTKSISDVLRVVALMPELKMSGVATIAERVNLPDIRVPQVAPSPLVRSVEANYASEFHRRLVKQINDFNAALDQQHEVGVRLVNFGQTIVFHLENIGYSNPSLIVFAGTTKDGSSVELIQHVSQISVLLMKLPRKDPSQPKRKFGFVPETEYSNGENRAKD